MNKLIAVFLALFALAGSVKADIVVLVHGYLGSPVSWEQSLVNQNLQAAGWQRGGILFNTPSGAMLAYSTHNTHKQQMYVVDLPSRAPAMLQAEHLQTMLNDLSKRHPNENFILVGHSAGGVVARIALVKYGAGQVTRLITIASPHLGTGRAVQALNETSEGFPFDILKDFFGGDLYQALKHSRGLLIDLLPARPGTMLYWLNSQPHPDIDYVSIVRGRDQFASGDQIVPGFSQDMNNVISLKGKTETHFLPTSHYLQPLDGQILVDLLKTGK